MPTTRSINQLFQCFLIMFSLAACDVEIQSTIATSEILDVVQEQRTNVPVRIIVHASISEERATEAARHIERAFAQRNIKLDYKGFNELRGSFNNRMIFEGNIPLILLHSPHHDKPATGMMVLISPAGNLPTSTYQISLRTNPEMIADIRAALRRQNGLWNVSDRNIRFKVSFVNDIRQNARLHLQEIFVDDQPTLEREVVLTRRQNVDLVLSDVLSSSLLTPRLGTSRVATIILPEK